MIIINKVLATIMPFPFQNKIFNKYINKPKLWLRYVDYTFVVYAHGRELFDLLLQQLNNEEN